MKINKPKSSDTKNNSANNTSTRQDITYIDRLQEQELNSLRNKYKDMKQEHIPNINAYRIKEYLGTYTIQIKVKDKLVQSADRPSWIDCSSNGTVSLSNIVFYNSFEQALHQLEIIRKGTVYIYPAIGQPTP